MSDQFIGSWLVSEYVFNPDGSFAGIVKQKRELIELANGDIRVIQHCYPDEALAKHPMGRFTGSPEFQLKIDGRHRRYLGPAVIGTGLAWGTGMMTGRGLWPQFGHNFRSFSFMPQGNHQLTGGKFYNATEMIANIAGVAIPENEEGTWPILAKSYQPSSTIWRGTKNTLSKNGQVISQEPYERNYIESGPDSYSWAENDLELSLNNRENRYNVAIRSDLELQGFAKFYGPLLEMEAYDDTGTMLESTEILDESQNNLVNIRRWLQDDQLDFVEVIMLRRA